MVRPVSSETMAIMAVLVDGPGTTANLAARAGIGKTSAMVVLNNLCARGECEKLDPVRVPGVKRPVPVYARPEPAEDDADDSAASNTRGGVHDLIAIWCGMVPGQGMQRGAAA